MGYVIGSVLIFSIVLFAGLILKDALDVIKGSFDGNWKRPVFSAIGLVGAYWFGTRCWKPLGKIAGKARRFRAIFSSIRKPIPILHSDIENPHLLYLRSFSAEYFRYLQTTSDSGRDGLAQKYETLERELDQILIAAARDQLPFFALANSRDASASSEIRVLYVPTPDWGSGGWTFHGSSQCSDTESLGLERKRHG